MSDTSLGEHITTFARPRNQTTQRMFWGMLALTVFCLLFVFAKGTLVIVAIAAFFPGILATAYGITALRDEARTVELYSRGMVIRRTKDNSERNRVMWYEVSEIFARNTDKAMGAVIVGGMLGGAVGGVLATGMVNATSDPTSLSLQFRGPKEKPLTFDRTYKSIFEPIQRAALDYWLAQANEQLRRGQEVLIGAWRLNNQGIVTLKETIPWNSITHVLGDRGYVDVTYRDAEKNKERRVSQPMFLRSSLVGVLVVQMQTTGIPESVGWVS